jgi:hypothetical protein
MMMKVSLLCLLASQATAFAPSPSFGRRSAPLRMATMSDEFTVGILGDLHMDPRTLEDYEAGRSHWLPIFQEAKKKQGDSNVALVSLGDLGESKSVRPKETTELFAGTTECHELAAEYLSSFEVPYEVVGGNHGTFLVMFCFCCVIRFLYIAPGAQLHHSFTY